MMRTIDAIESLIPNAEYEFDPIKNKILKWYSKEKQPSDDEIQAKLNELQSAEPMRVLREERNQKLAETDWWCCSDNTPNKAQLDYRTALRNLPSTASPSLDENGNLIGVNWPEKPQN
jgi:hypothetical protein